MSADEENASQDRHIHTGGGAYVEGKVDTAGGPFAGRDLTIVEARSDREELLDYLDRAVAEYEARILQRVVRRRGVPEQPYKFLYAFELEDEDIFFGRDAAGEALHKVVLKEEAR